MRFICTPATIDAQNHILAFDQTLRRPRPYFVGIRCMLRLTGVVMALARFPTLRPGALRIATSALVCVIVFGCGALGAANLPSSHSQATIAADTSLFSAVVDEIAARAHVAVPVRVDPRVVRHEVLALPADSVFTRAGAESMTLDPVALSRLVPVDIIAPTATSLAKEPPEVIRRRRNVLRQLGVQETDALVDALCPGALLPPTPEVEQRRAAACPKGKQYVSVILSQSRPGGAYWPGFIDERVSGRAKGQWTVRATERTMTAHGSSAAVYDYVAEPAPDGKGWRIVKAVQLLLTD